MTEAASVVVLIGVVVKDVDEDVVDNEVVKDLVLVEAIVVVIEELVVVVVEEVLVTVVAVVVTDVVVGRVVEEESS